MDDKAALLSQGWHRSSFDLRRHQASSCAKYPFWNNVMDCCCLICPPSPVSYNQTKYQHGAFSAIAAEQDEPGLGREMIYVGSGKSIDLLSDEGSSFQDDQWRLSLRDKLSLSQEGSHAFYDELATTATFDSALELLTRTYTASGLLKCVPRIQNILNNIQPFTAAITTMVQADPTIACLVWGSVQLVLETLMRFTAIFNGIGDMLQEISKDLPRFHAYMEILHTPRLNQALRDLYDIFVVFNFKVVEFLKMNKCVITVKMQWASMEKEFQTTRRQLRDARNDFDAEVRLADVQTQRQRHLEVLDQFSSLSTNVNLETIMSALPSRNPMFEGRINEVSQLHSNLEPSFSPEKSQRSQCSCVIHGVGGMGKTQTALEYVYRYRPCYSYVFWINAESNTTLSDSFLASIRLLPILLDGLNPARQRQVGLEWLQSTAHPWLIVFDNVEDASMLAQFWPRGIRGAIIITTQNPDLIYVGTTSINLQPMTPVEGSALIQRYLRRGGSEQAAAENLSEDLGGLPLAITHFAGYVAKSQCPIQQISESFRDRAKSSRAWTAESVASTSMYAHTLATVWDLAWRRLTSDSRLLLEMIAFLDPDGIPEEMFTGANEDTGTSEWQYWDKHRFNEAIAVLRERHLIERDLKPSGATLRTHRALQRSILHRLDGDVDHRKHVFSEVVGLVRRAFPESNMAKRGDLSQLASCEKYISQVISVHAAFVESKPHIDGDITLLTIFRDSAYFLLNNGYQVDGIPLSETGIRLGRKFLETDRSEAFPALLDCISCLGIFNEWLGTKGRLLSVQLTAGALEMLETHFANIPIEKWTELEKIRYGRAEHEYGVKITHFNKMEESSKILDKAMEYYSKAKDQESIKSRIANLISFKAFISATRQDAEQAVALAQKSRDMMADTLGSENPWSVQARTGEAMIAFTVGNIDRATVMYKELLEIRLRIGGKNGHDTLACQYNVAVCYQNSGLLENAESHLREILLNSCINLQWREEDVARVKFRLSLVLRAMNRPREAAEWRDQALAARKAWEDQYPDFEGSDGFTDKDDMKLFDDGVILHHGRTTGIWSNGTYW